ncbi:MAG: hypothetical protein KGH54_01615 [Candidatus Micrarchaeota archaeon]|nr:hypothetical protein [Candidatus Micrarchaeota archaeon]
MKEIETKIVGFDEKKLRATLRKKAKYVAKRHFKRYVFDMVKKGNRGNYDEFVRVRTDGKVSTLTYKFREGKGIDNTEELETHVGDFEKAARIMSKIGLWSGSYKQENIVEIWVYKGTEITIARWPLIPKFVEVEGKSVKAVRQAIKELGIDGREVGNLSYAKLFAMFGKGGRDQGNLKFSN